MDYLTFISKIADALAWPIVALILGIVFRKRLLELLPNMKKFKAGPVEAEFEIATKQVLAATSDTLISNKLAMGPEAENVKPNKKIIVELLQARTDPAGMILEGWGQIDGALFQLGLQLGLCDDPLESTTKVYSRMMLANVLPEEVKEVIKKLRELRNEVAHVRVIPTVDAAQSYLVAANNVSDAILAYRKGLPSYERTGKSAT